MQNTIKVERAIKNMTQADLAEKIGVSRQTINAIETNKYVPSTILALKMAKLFGKKVEEIFTLEKGDWGMFSVFSLQFTVFSFRFGLQFSVWSQRSPDSYRDKIFMIN